MGCSSGGGLGGLFGPMHAAKPDADAPTDNEPNFGHFIFGLLLLGPMLWVAGAMGLLVWSYIGVIVPSTIIGLAIWACGRYGTNDSLLTRITYRTTAAQRDRILRRISDPKKSEK